ncbi:MaoC family dehydratase [Streptosporangium sp. NBC_01639]|uniref:MaoC family dehydratase n=1 Tax=unclassified Streptosporangium TaxID=2632669 RepID=UPI002DD7F66D|nr:MaoC family dehydratase [Streptosporangium sp. NBC_01756]WSC90413.1 MaoC family dehydratase [Streptosporangium sp. NBC_01756]WTD58712.1 MaoC family dehydratase [Streptosporangium sp. NBC_01639]
MRIFNSLTELKAAVGEHLGYTEWRQITQEQVDLFADATDDHQWIHVDVEKAKEGPFGGTIAHGYLSLSLLPAFMAELVRVGGLAMGINYGLNKVRFPAPVPVGARIRAGAELVDLKGTPSGYLSNMRLTVEVEGGKRPACIAETLSLYVPAESP